LREVSPGQFVACHHPRVDAVKGATVPPNTTAWFLGD
jgi:hypothetical protein